MRRISTRIKGPWTHKNSYKQAPRAAYWITGTKTHLWVRPRNEHDQAGINTQVGVERCPRLPQNTQSYRTKDYLSSLEERSWIFQRIYEQSRTCITCSNLTTPTPSYPPSKTSSKIPILLPQSSIAMQTQWSASKSNHKREQASSPGRPAHLFPHAFHVILTQKGDRGRVAMSKIQ